METESNPKGGYLVSKHSCGKLSLKDDPILLRLVVKTELEPTEELKDEIKKLWPAYFVIWERF